MRSFSSRRVPGRRAQAHAIERGVGVGKDLGSHAGRQKIDQAGSRGQVNERQRPSPSQYGGQVAVIKRAQAAMLLPAAPLPHHPGGEHRHQTARKQVRRDHRERHRQRQRHKQLASYSHHEKRRHEDGQNAKHGEQAGHRRPAARLHHGPRARNARRHLGMDVLDLDRRLIHQDPDRQREAAQCHDVDALAGQPEQDHRAQQGERDIQNDDRGAAPVAKKQQHHQAGERRAEQPFRHQAAQANW
jgi:hypothetical protein